ncbi:hypothetical protein D3C79_942680 [compost metagenome]
MPALVVPGFQPESGPVPRATFHRKVTDHHVVIGIQKDQRPFIRGDRRSEVHISPLNLVSAARALKANIEPSVIANR